MSVNSGSGRTCLLVTNIFPPAVGGSSQVYAALAASAQGDIVVLTSSHDHETGCERADWRAADRKVDFPVRRLKCIRPFLRIAYSGSGFTDRLHEAAGALTLIAAIAFFRLRYRVRAICIADDESMGWLTILSKYFLGCRTLIYCHGDDLHCAQDLMPRRSRWFGLADKVVAANRYAAHLLTSVFGVPDSKIALVPNGVDLAVFHPGPPPASLIQHYGLAGRRVLLTVTRLVPRKGVDKVLEVLPAVLRKFPDIAYLIVGDGPQLAVLQQMAQESGIADLVKFASQIDHNMIADFYRAADIVLLPNRAEGGEADGLPLVFLEANACAKPVIGGQAGGSAEIIRDGENGLVVDGGDVAKIAYAICQLLRDEKLRDAMGQKGFEMAQNWGWGSRTQQFLEACRK
jgi:phosphatidylinositol alpha-1,6-mannosyltransferase